MNLTIRIGCNFRAWLKGKIGATLKLVSARCTEYSDFTKYCAYARSARLPDPPLKVERLWCINLMLYIEESRSPVLKMRITPWRKLPVSLTELCLDTTLRCGQSFR